MKTAPPDASEPVTRNADRIRAEVLGLPVDVVDYRSATDRILATASKGSGGYVCVANVHMVMEAHDDSHFAEVVTSADLVVPDGMPLVWWLRAIGHKMASRVRGPTLVLWLAERAAAEGVPVGLYGGTPETADRFAAALQDRYPALKVATVLSPPFRPLSEDELDEQLTALGESGARIVLVGLGCPKQEWWMGQNAERLPAVSIGVGAAFDLIAGSIPEAPRWMQAASLEWLFRLAVEPRRLWKRYLVSNSRFVAYSLSRLFTRSIRSH